MRYQRPLWFAEWKIGIKISKLTLSGDFNWSTQHFNLKGTSIFLTFCCRSSVRPFEVVTGLLIFGPVRGFVSVAWLFAPGPRCRAA
ncbi:MAG: hypothetical protein ACI8TF_003132 [Paracoccaceae bacterium]